MIPKIILQTWKNSDIPEHWASSPRSIKQWMPDWRYVLMTDLDNRKFVQLHFPDFLSHYDAFPYPIQRADAIRYLWLYVHGGLYLDLDYELKHSLESLFTDDSEVFLVPSGNIGSYMTNSLMASQPRASLWLEMIRAMMQPCPSWIITKHFIVMNTTGPMKLTQVVKTTGSTYSILPSKLLLPCSVCEIEDGVCNSSGAWLQQLNGSSWHSLDSKIIGTIYCKWKFLGFLLLLIFLLLIKTISSI